MDNRGLAMTAIPIEVQSMPSDLYSSDQTLSYSTEPITRADNMDTAMIDIMRADLDQVFFDRVHPVLPIIYYRRYFSWADKEHPGATQLCLRSAMRAMAAAMSAPGRRFCDQLYTETCDLLQAHNIDSKADISVEYVQAWLLLAHYELLRGRVSGHVDCRPLPPTCAYGASFRHRFPWARRCQLFTGFPCPHQLRNRTRGHFFDRGGAETGVLGQLLPGPLSLPA